MGTIKNSTTRFSNRVDNYVKHRPGYPDSIVQLLQQYFGADTSKIIVDIGAGTGISSEIFLKAGYRVTAVEPNKEMREKSIELLAHYPGFTAVNGTAETSGLPDHSADMIICAQAFHWFDKEKTRAAFKKLLNKDGILVLIWNERLTTGEFQKAYDELIGRHAMDYVQVDHRNTSDEDIKAFYSPEPYRLTILSNQQIFDFEGLKGRLLSSSYMPNESNPGFDAMIKDLQQLFDLFNDQGKVIIRYKTKMYTGQL
jgi:SAM-dependent methyltransferase